MVKVNQRYWCNLRVVKTKWRVAKEFHGGEGKIEGWDGQIEDSKGI